MILLAYRRRSGKRGTVTMRERRPWVRDVWPIAALAALAAVKLWAIVTPFAAARRFLGGDFGLAVEPFFYHQLKRGVLPLWDLTLGTGSPFLGGGTHTPCSSRLICISSTP